MIYLLLVLGLALVFFINTRRGGKRNFLLFPLFFLLASVFFVYQRPWLSSSDTLFVMDEPAYTVKFKGKSKFERITHEYRGIADVILTEVQTEHNFVSDNGGLVYSVKGMNDIGIDTVFTSIDSMYVNLKLYCGKFPPSSLFIYSSGNMLAFNVQKDSLSFQVKGTDYDSAVLKADDDNPFNQKFASERKPIILIVDDSYSKKLQTFSLDMQRMFPYAEFRSAIRRKGKLITLKKDFDAYISLSHDFSDTLLPCLTLSEPSVNGKTYVDIDNFISQLNRGEPRIKNPFNPEGKRINLTPIKSFLLTVRHHLLSVILFLLSLWILYLLF